jgi:alanyl-tRNA synthetase
MFKIENLKKYIKAIPWIGQIFLLLALSFRIAVLNDENKKLKDDPKIQMVDNKELIQQISSLQDQLKDYNKQINNINEKISQKEIEIIEKEKIIYKDGELYIPDDYEQLKENYIVSEQIIKDKNEIIKNYEDKSKKDADIIFNLTKNLDDTNTALDESNVLIKKLSKKKWLEHSIIVGSSIGLEPKLYSVDISYMILFGEKVYLGAGFSSDLKVRVYVGVKF